MIYDLSKEIDNKKAIDRFKVLLDKKCMIELKEKKHRSLNQNSYLHLILTWFSVEYGCSMEYVKYNYFKKLNKDIFLECVISKKSGKEFGQYRSSADLDSAEMTICIEKFRNWSGQNGIYLPSPEEKEYLKEIEIEINRNRY